MDGGGWVKKNLALTASSHGVPGVLRQLVVTDGWWWWMVVVVVDGGGWWWWWMVEKKFFNFAETWQSDSSRYINVHKFRVLLKQLFYGNEIKLQV